MKIHLRITGSITHASVVGLMPALHIYYRKFIGKCSRKNESHSLLVIPESSGKHPFPSRDISHGGRAPCPPMTLLIEN